MSKLNRGACAYLTESVDKIVLQKSTPAQIRQLALYIIMDKLTKLRES